VPRLGPDRLRAAFTAAEGWGTYTQEIDPDRTMRALIELRYGRLRLRTLRLGHVGLADATRAEIKLGEKVITCALEREPLSFLLRFPEDLPINAGEVLVIQCRA
jgi:non-lysosomal glucosylceramidase